MGSNESDMERYMRQRQGKPEETPEEKRERLRKETMLRYYEEVPTEERPTHHSSPPNADRELDKVNLNSGLAAAIVDERYAVTDYAKLAEIAERLEYANMAANLIDIANEEKRHLQLIIKMKESLPE